ncbi:MAG: hypothetical protein WD008_03650, partial [Balneolaceae bacterium]
YYETWVLDQSIAEVNRTGNSTEIVIEDLGKVPMPVHLEITYTNGTTTRELVEVDYWLDGHRTKVLTVPSRSGVRRVEIDPDTHFPDINRSNNVWER